MSNERGSKFLQYFAAIAANLSALASSAMIAWTSPILQKLEQKDPIADDNPFGHAITSDEASWIASISIPGTVIGCFFFGYLAKRWGRKKALLSCIIPCTISWIITAIAKNVAILCIARFIAGFATGGSFSILPMYTVEISEKSIRGTLGSFMQVFLNIGWLFSFSIGPFVSYTIFIILCALLPILFFIVFYFCPESPYYLAAQGEHEQMIKVLAKFRGKSINSVKAEANEIQINVETTANIDTSIMDLIRVQRNLKALFYSCMLFIFQDFSGALVMLYYANTIFAAAAGKNETISPAISTIIIGVVQLVFCCIAPLFVDNWGRKKLLIISGVGEVLSLSALGLYFYLAQRADNGDGDVSGISWLPITSMMIFFAVYSIGWGPVVWCILGELFTSEIKGKAFAIATTVLGLTAFLILKLFSNLVDAFGIHSVFWLFAIVCLISIVFTIFVLPETKGKSLQEIQFELEGDF